MRGPPGCLACLVLCKESRWRYIAPSGQQSASHGVLLRRGQIEVRPAPTSPRPLDRRENIRLGIGSDLLLAWREFHDSSVLVRPQRRETFPCMRKSGCPICAPASASGRSKAIALNSSGCIVLALGQKRHRLLVHAALAALVDSPSEYALMRPAASANQSLRSRT